MKLYLLKERDDTGIETEIGTYDTFDEFVSRAKNEKDARRIAKERESNSHAASDWENPAVTSCTPITGKGEEGIVISSFRAG